MKKVLRKVGRVLKSLSPRGWKWSRFEKSWLKEHASCAACGSTSFLEVHHKLPFAMRPDLEFEPSNVVTLCMNTHRCHLKIGHGGSWRFYNPVVDADLLKIASGDSVDSVALTAKSHRTKIIQGS